METSLGAFLLRRRVLSAQARVSWEGFVGDYLREVLLHGSAEDTVDFKGVFSTIEEPCFGFRVIIEKGLEAA